MDKKINTPQSVLRSARKLIENPDNWTTFRFARDSNRQPVEPDSPLSVCWCSAGAINRAERDGLAGGEIADRAFIELAKTISGYSGKESADAAHVIFEFNDETSHKRVIQAFDETIERLEKA